MGTPLFAVYALQAIDESEHSIVGVVTNIDKPAGRGKKLQQSAVKEYAKYKGLNLFQPQNLKDPNFTDLLKKLKADIFVVVAFRMLPKSIWNIPRKGTFNLHASLLPNYRGAAPINWALINNETTTGLTTFYICDQIDTGAVLMKESIEIDSYDTFGTLHDKLAPSGSILVLKTIELLKTNPNPIKQELKGNEKNAPKLTKENTKIDWNKPLKAIDALVRGLNPHPYAWTEIQNGTEQLKVKISRVTFDYLKHDYNLKNMIIEGKKIKIAHSEGILIIEELQLPNKKIMDSQSLLNGFNFKAGAKVL
tara:strand:- start:174 stop:1094 length:921 start_codon:yes stop_codon:yes gene_type:complete